MQLEKNLSKKNILIIDDLVESRSTLKRMLTSAGAVNIYMALDGVEAMQKMGERSYDIVFSDYDLGKGKDGQQILEEARHIKLLGSNSMFIMVTSENAIDRVMGALEYEPDDYITRPFTLKTLKDRIEQSLMSQIEMQSINRALDEGDYERAIKLCCQTIDESPKNKTKIQVSRILGRLYLKAKRFKEAQTVYAGISNGSNISWAQLGLAVSLYHQGKIDEAEEQLRSTLEAHPLYVQCYDWLAKIHKGRNERIKAQEELELAVGISPKFILRQMELGQLALENKDYQTAKNAFNQAIALGKHSCYKSKQNYLDYIYSVIEDLPNASSLRDKRLQIDRANRALNEFRTESTVQFDALYSSASLEFKLAEVTDDEPRKEKAISYAQQCYEKIENPCKSQKKQLVSLLVASERYVDARKHIMELKQGKLSNVDEIEIHELEQKLDPMVFREYSTKLNEQGVRLYQKQQYKEAVEVFDEAVSFAEASINVLMNAIQTKLAYAEENSEVSALQSKDCDFLFQRIEHLSTTDKRHKRFKRLKDLQLELKKSL